MNLLSRIGPRTSASLLLAAYGLYVLVACKSAWLCDDAFITLRGETATARPLYERVLSYNPQLAEARLRLGRAYELEGRRAEAIVEYRAYLSEHPDDSRVAEHVRSLVNP
jgi:tetratricopeptide (TPR) repeat protein